MEEVIKILNYCCSKLGELNIEASDKNLDIVLGVKQLLRKSANALAEVVEANREAPQPEQVPADKASTPVPREFSKVEVKPSK